MRFYLLLLSFNFNISQTLSYLLSEICKGNIYLFSSSNINILKFMLFNFSIFICAIVTGNVIPEYDVYIHLCFLYVLLEDI